MIGEQVSHQITPSRRRLMTRSRSKSLRQWEERIKYRRGKGSGEPQQSSAQTQIVAKVFPAPKVNNREVRTNNQQTAPVSAQREVKRSEVEATQDASSDNVLPTSRDHSEAIIEFAFSRRKFLLPKHPSCLRWSPRTRGKNHPRGTSGKLGQKNGLL